MTQILGCILFYNVTYVYKCVQINYLYKNIQFIIICLFALLRLPLFTYIQSYM